MSEAQKCPVCNGRGTVSPGFYSKDGFTSPYNAASTAPMRETCQACGGKGIVWPPHTYYPQPMPQIPISVPTLPQWQPGGPVPWHPPYRITC